MIGKNKTSVKVSMVSDKIKMNATALEDIDKCVRFIANEIELSKEGKIDAEYAEVVSYVNTMMEEIAGTLDKMPLSHLALISNKISEANKVNDIRSYDDIRSHVASILKNY